jgi:hypothetical protein
VIAAEPAAAILREAHMAPPIHGSFGSLVSRRIAVARASLVLDTGVISLT